MSDPQRAERRPRSKAAGFSLVELLVALAILLIALSIAAEIGIRARALLARSVRDARRPPIAATLARIRDDIAQAERFDPAAADPIWGWTFDPLVLRSSSGTVIYRVAGSTLERATVDSTGREAGRLDLVRDGASWRWRAFGDSLVEISVGYLAEPGAPGAAGRVVRRESLRVALRGAPGRWGW